MSKFEECLKEKSLLYRDEALRLRHEKRYTAIPHLVYYSCFQQLTILQRRAKAKKLLHKETYGMKGSHNLAFLDFSETLIYHGMSFDDSIIIVICMMKLKKYRTRADYGASILTEEEAEDAYGMAAHVLTKIKKYV